MTKRGSHFVAFILLATGLGFARQAWSQNFAHCDQAQQQVIDSKNFGSEDEERRLALIDSLVQDYRLLLDREAISKIPRSYLNTCFTNKSKAWKNATEFASSSTKAKTQYKLALARVAEYQNQPEQAYKLYSAILSTNSNDYSLRWAAFANWHTWQMQKIQSADIATFSHTDVDRLTKQLYDLTQPLINSAQAPRQYKVEALRKRARFTQYGLKSYVRAQQDWKALLAIEPSDKEALQAVAAFHDQRNELAEARQPLEKLGKVDPKNIKAVRRSLQIALQEQDYNGARIGAKEALKRYPKDAQLNAILAASLAKTGEPDQALAMTRSLLKAHPKLQLARETQADVLEEKGRVLASKKLYGQALSLYDESLKLKPKNEKLRTEMALLLYDYRRDSNFEPAGVSRIDMDATMKMLKPVLAQSAVDPNVLTVGISASVRSSNPKAAAALCDRHDREFGALPSVELVMDCSAGYKAAGQRSKAEALLQGALKNPKYRQSSSKITEALSGLIVQ